MISITTATAEDLSTIAEIEQICFPTKEGASLSAIKSRYKVFPNHFLVKKSWLYTSAKRNQIPMCRIAGKNYYSKRHIE